MRMPLLRQIMLLQPWTKFLTVFAVWLTFVIAGAELQRPPNYHHDHMPNTSFTCDGKVVGGYYADPEAYCQMFHVCVQVDENDVRDFRFMCPDDTVFDQENFICANWFEIDCRASTIHYNKNLNLFHPEDETKNVQKGTSKNPINQEEISNQLRRQQEQQKQQLLQLEQQQQQLFHQQQKILDRHQMQQQAHQQKQLKIVEDQQRQQLAFRPPEGRKVPSAAASNSKAQQIQATTKSPEYEETTVEYDYYYYDYEDDTTEQQGQFFMNDEYDPNAPGRVIEPKSSKPPVLPIPVSSSKGSSKPSGTTRQSRR